MSENKEEIKKQNKETTLIRKILFVLTWIIFWIFPVLVTINVCKTIGCYNMDYVKIVLSLIFLLISVYSWFYKNKFVWTLMIILFIPIYLLFIRF